MDITALNDWFQREKRDFPWRREPSPYAVWVSEVMLQQTQASVVIDYFERWMARFPSIEVLAKAPIEEVVKEWEGLGYYSRARALHEGARMVVQNYGGKFPSSREELAKIKGLGPYSIGALLSFAFHQKAAAVDGNVARVLSRHFLIEEDICKSQVQKRLRTLTEELLPEKEPWTIMEALIELGAQVCQKQPKCFFCPLQTSCLGFRTQRAPLLPFKGKKQLITPLSRSVAVIMHEDNVLIRQEKEGRVMGGLYEFPYFPKIDSLKKTLHDLFGEELSFEKHFPIVKHSFTRYRAELFPSLWKCARKDFKGDWSFVSLRDAKKLPFSSGHRRILQHLLKELNHV